MIPSSLGHIPTLQMIEVCGRAKAVKESAKQSLEEQHDMGNEDLKVIISDLGSEEQEESGREEQSEEQEESESEEQCEVQEEKELLKRQTGKTRAIVLISLLLAILLVGRFFIPMTQRL
ncbi:Hypothetical predicted protein [Olea europaea subsp. europaea]|uniref:Uncharacterized protein n=1 Tax=Olea europaea subsp. europaea TaxID=158383 RepID=A0A8S0RAT3_OLEEU|nr:Hypothetical predicted protein [Olea europaea subsp. europaea]